MRRLLLVLLLCAAACAGEGRKPDSAPAGEASGRQPAEEAIEPGQGGIAPVGRGLAGIDAARTEVAAIRAAALEAISQLAVDESAWEAARLAISSPLDRQTVERRLAEAARRSGLELSQFQLAPMSMPQLDFRPRVHPAAPYPVRPRDAVIEAPIRFALTPLAPERIEAFLRALPNLRPLVIVNGVEAGRDYVEVQASAVTFRPFVPVPRYALEVPPPESFLDESGNMAPGSELAMAWEALVREVDEANAALIALSEARLRRVRLQGLAAAEEKAARHAAQIEWPPADPPD